MKVTADGSMRMTREHIGGFENRMAGRTGTDARKEFRYLSFGMEMFLRYARSGFYEFDDAKMVFLEQLEDQERFRETTVLREKEVRDLLSFYFQTREQSIEKHWYYRQAAGYISRQIEMKLRELRYLDASAAGRLEQIYHTDLTQFSEKEKKLFLESLVQGANAQRQNSGKKGILPGAEGYIQADRIRPYQRMPYQAKRLPDAKTLFYQSAQKQWKEYEKTFFQDAQRKSMSKAEEVSGNLSLPQSRWEERKVPAATTAIPEKTAGGIAGNHDADHARASLEHFYQSILEKRQEGKWEDGYDMLSDTERIFLKQGQQEEENGERIKRQPVLTPKELQSFVEHAGEGLIGEIRDALSVETRQEIERELHLQTEEWKTEETDSLVLMREFLKKELVTWKDTGEKAGENAGEETIKTRVGQEKEGGAEKRTAAKTEAFRQEEKRTAERTAKTEVSRQEEKRIAEKTAKTEVSQQEEKRAAERTGKIQVSRQEQERQISALYAEKGSREKENTERKIQKREKIWQEELRKAVKNVFLQDLELYRENLREWERKVQTERFFERKEEAKEEIGRKFPAEEKEIVQKEAFAEEKEPTEKQGTEEREKTQKKLSAEEKEKEQKGLLTEEDKNQKNIAAKDGKIFTKKLESETAENVLKGFRSVPERTEGQKIEHSSADMTIRPLEHFYQNILKKQEEIQEEGYESFSNSERVFLRQGQPEEESGRRVQRQPALAPEELTSFLENAGEGLIEQIHDSLSAQTRQEIEQKLNQQTEERKAEGKETQNRLLLLREFLQKELSAWKYEEKKTIEKDREEKTKEIFRQKKERAAEKTGKTEDFRQEQRVLETVSHMEKETTQRENRYRQELKEAVRNVFLQDLELYRENLREWERKVQTERFFERKEETEEETGRKFPAEEKEIVQREAFAEEKELTEKQGTEEREKTQKKLSAEEKEKEQKGLLTEEDKNQKNIAAKEGEIFTKKLKSETAENVLKGFRSVPERTEGQKIEHSSADMTIRPLEHFYQNILKKQEEIQEEGYESFSNSERVFLRQGQPEEESGRRTQRQPALAPEELTSFLENAGEGLIKEIHDSLSAQTKQEVEQKLNQRTEEGKEAKNRLLLLREFLQKELLAWKYEEKKTIEKDREEKTKESFRQEKERIAEKTGKTEDFRQEKEADTEKTESFRQEQRVLETVSHMEKEITQRENRYRQELKEAVRNVLLQDLKLYQENWKEWEREKQTERFFDRKEETSNQFPAGEKESVQRESFVREKETVVGKTAADERKTDRGESPAKEAETVQRKMSAQEGKEKRKQQETKEREKTQEQWSAEEKEKEQKGLFTEEKNENQKNIALEHRKIPEKNWNQKQKIEYSSADMTIRPLEHFYQSILKKQEETQEEGYGSFSDSERVFLKQGQPGEESVRRVRRQPALAPEELQSFLENASEGLVKEIQDSFSERTRQEVERQLNLQAEEGKTVRNHLVLLREFLKKELSVWKDTRKTAGENAGEKTTKTDLGQRKEDGAEKPEKTGAFRQTGKRTAEGTGKTQISRQEQESQTSALYAEKGSREKEDTERKIQKREEILRKELEKAVRNVLLQDLELYRENLKEWKQKVQTEPFFDGKEEAWKKLPVEKEKSVPKESFAEAKKTEPKEALAGEKKAIQEKLLGKERKEIPTEIIPELHGMGSGDIAGKPPYEDMTSRPLQYLYQEILNKTPGERTEKQEGYERVFDGNGELVFFKQAQEEETKEAGQEVTLTPKQMDVFLSNVRGEIITDICNSLSKETRKELEERLLQTEELKAEKAGQDRMLFLMREFLRQELSLQEKKKAENYKQKPAEKKEEELRQETIRRRTKLQEVVQTVFLQDLKQYQGSPEEWKTLQKKEDNAQKKLEEKRPEKTIENFYEEQISEKEKADSRKETGKKGQKEMPPDLMNRPLQYMRQAILEKTHGENNSAASGYEEFSEAERVLLRQEEKEIFRETEQALEHTKELEELMAHTEEHVLENVRKSLNLEAAQEGNRKREAENVLKEISVLKTGSSTVTEHLLKTSAYLQPSLKSLSNGNMAKQIMEQADPEKMVFPHREEEHFPWEYAGNLSFSEGGNSEAGYEHMQTGEEKNYRIFHENITKQFSEILINNPMLWKQIGQETKLPETIVKEAVKNQGTVDRLVTHLEKESVFKESIRQEIREREKEDRVLVYQKLPQEGNVQEKHRQKAEEDIPGIPTVLREEVEAFGIVEKEREVSMQELEQRVEKQGEQIQQLLQEQKELIKQLSSKENDREMAKKTFRRYEERMLLERMRYGL